MWPKAGAIWRSPQGVADSVLPCAFGRQEEERCLPWGWDSTHGACLTTMAFLGLLEGQRTQPKPHADLFSEVMANNTFDPLMSLTKTPNEDSRCHHRRAST